MIDQCVLEKVVRPGQICFKAPKATLCLMSHYKCCWGASHVCTVHLVSAARCASTSIKNFQVDKPGSGATWQKVCHQHRSVFALQDHSQQPSAVISVLGLVLEIVVLRCASSRRLDNQARMAAKGALPAAYQTPYRDQSGPGAFVPFGIAKGCRFRYPRVFRCPSDLP